MLNKFSFCFLLMVSVLLQINASAHTINYQLDDINQDGVFWKYLFIGFKHIIPLGVDHILFILCVFFLNKQIKVIVLQASMFTIAHSITLALAMYGIIKPPPNIIEPLIAVSIVMLAIENILTNEIKPWRIILVFLFGLVHGMGFAGALSELGLPKNAFAISLVAFNIGVELGQLSIIMLMYFLVSKQFSMKPWYRKRIVIPTSIVVALIASYWTIQRVFIAS